MDKHIHTTIIIVFTSSGAENTREINIPLESKYWYLEKSLKEIANERQRFVYCSSHIQLSQQLFYMDIVHIIPYLGITKHRPAFCCIKPEKRDS